MASIAQSIAYTLLNTSAVSDLVSTRVYHDTAQQDTTSDYIVLSRLGGKPVQHLGNTTADMNDVSYQIDCWSTSAEGAQALAVAVVATLQNYTGNLGQAGATVAVTFAGLETERSDYSVPTDGAETGMYRRMLDFQLWHEDP